MLSFLFGIILTITGLLGPFLVEPALGLAVFSAFTHITPAQLSIVQFRAPFIVAIATLLGYLASKDYPQKFNKFPLEMKLFAVILIGMYLGARNAFDSRLAFEHFTIYLKYGVFLLLMVNILNSLKRLEVFNNFLILGAAWLVYKCWDLRGTTGARFENIGGGTVGDSNQYAAALIILLPLVFMRVFRTTSPVYIRIGALLGVFGMIMAILISVSRGAFLGLSVLVVCFFILFQQYRKYTIICALLLVLAVSPFVPEHYYSRINTIFSSTDESRDYSAQSRLAFWETSIDVWKQHPLFGCGLRNFIYYNGAANEGKEWGAPGHVAHSLWFEALAEGGVFVFVPLVFMLLLFFKRISMAKMKYKGNKVIHADLCAFQIGMIGFLVCATFVNRLIYEPMYWWCMIAYAYYSGVSSSDEEVVRYVKR